jgi:N-acetylglucosaminyldiphosphoundecaprenol N-acetyl-beta-D-mannosaminyltransferase
MSVIPADEQSTEIHVLGVKINLMTFSDFCRVIDSAIEERGKLRIYYANAHTIDDAQSHEKLRQAINEGDYVYCDGFGVALLARLLGQPAPQRFTAPDWLHDISPHWAAKQYRLYFLGSEPEVAAKAAITLKRQHPNLNIIGTHDGYFDMGKEQSGEVIELINATKPDIFLVGFGSPSQEYWINRHYQEVAAPVTIAVGGAFDYISGHKPRAPRWMTRMGFEWLGRLVTEPRRLFVRYVIGLPRVLLKALLVRLSMTK